MTRTFPQPQSVKFSTHLLMKRHLILLTFALLAGFAPASRANLIYDGTDRSIPLNFGGVYLNVATGATSLSVPFAGLI